LYQPEKIPSNQSPPGLRQDARFGAVSNKRLSGHAGFAKPIILGTATGSRVTLALHYRGL
jgi:hypothetical protein